MFELIFFMILDQIIFSKKAQSRGFEDIKHSEKPLRSVLKALSWRVVGTLDTLLVSYIFLGEIGLATSIASIDFITKLVLYFFHERIWNTIKWGK
jgi:uncharacterized membrane protein